MTTGRMEVKLRIDAKYEEVRLANRIGRLLRERVAGTGETRLLYETAPERTVLLVARDVDTPLEQALAALKRKEKIFLDLIYEPEKYSLVEIAGMLNLEPEAVLAMERAMVRHLYALMNPAKK